MVLCTGGMSCDPDDMTPSAIKESGAQIISYWGLRFFRGRCSCLAVFRMEHRL